MLFYLGKYVKQFLQLMIKSKGINLSSILDIAPNGYYLYAKCATKNVAVPQFSLDIGAFKQFLSDDDNLRYNYIDRSIQCRKMR